MKTFRQFQEDISPQNNPLNQANLNAERRQVRQKVKSQKNAHKSTTTNDEYYEAYDPEVQGRSQIRKTGDGGRLYPSKKKSKPEIRRVKAVGGGKTAPVEYKDRKDIGQQRARSSREQQPTQERGSASDRQKAAAKEARRQAALARRGAKSGADKSKDKSKDLSKQATKLLSKKKEEKPVSKDYKPAKASGMTRSERMSQQRKGESKLKGIMKQQETDKYKKATGQNPDRKAKTKILGRVSKRMAN